MTYIVCGFQHLSLPTTTHSHLSCIFFLFLKSSRIRQVLFCDARGTLQRHAAACQLCANHACHCFTTPTAPSSLFCSRTLTPLQYALHAFSYIARDAMKPAHDAVSCRFYTASMTLCGQRDTPSFGSHYCSRLSASPSWAQSRVALHHISHLLSHLDLCGRRFA